MHDCPLRATDPGGKERDRLDADQHFAMLCEAKAAALRHAVSAAEVQRYLEGG